MNPIVALQTALDNALVAPDDRLWFPISKIKDSSLYQFKLDKKKCRINVEFFQDILQICPRLSNQEFDEPPSDEEIISFVKELGYKGDIRSVTEVYTDHMHQHWRTFADIINKCLSGKTTGLDKIRLLRAQILWGMQHDVVPVADEEETLILEELNQLFEDLENVLFHNKNCLQNRLSGYKLQTLILNNLTLQLSKLKLLVNFL
ncbi:hypothetical protein Tco_1496365, partial [Tanacetum coccineum]